MPAQTMTTSVSRTRSSRNIAAPQHTALTSRPTLRPSLAAAGAIATGASAAGLDATATSYAWSWCLTSAILAQGASIDAASNFRSMFGAFSRNINCNTKQIS